MTKIGVIGRSHLGVVWSAVLAEIGNKVIYLKSARFEVYEPGLKELIQKNIKNDNLEYDNSYSRLKECDVVFLALDISTDAYNNIQLDSLNRIIAAIIPNLNEKAIFVIMSQVPPGFMRSIDFPKERLFHQVDTLIFGESIEKALQPRYIIVGSKSGDQPAEAYYNVLISLEPLYREYITYEEAEIYKLAMNANLAAQIAVTNTMAELCGHIGASWEAVSETLKRDKRIGTYLKSGLGIGGGHLERDLNTIEVLSRKHGFNSDIIGASISSSKYMQYWALRKLRDELIRDTSYEIAIWGLSYKENTNSIKDSAAIATIEALPKCKFLVHDPEVNLVRLNLLTVDDPLEAIDEKTDALLIMTPHDMYKRIKEEDILKQTNIGNPPVIIDPYKVLYMFKDSCYPYHTLG